MNFPGERVPSLDERPAPAGRLDRLPWALVVGLVAASLASVFVSMSVFRLVDADEGFYLFKARVVMNGDLPYHDFFYPQTPLLPYVYGLWMQVFGFSWYSGRVLTGLFAAAIGLLLYHHLARLTGARAFGVLAAGLLASTNLALEWLTPAKTQCLGTLLVFASYVVFFSRVTRWKYFWSGLLAGLAIDTRVYLGVVVPILLLALLSREWRAPDRIMQIARFAVGLAIALLPNEFFVLLDPDVFFFNILGFYGVRAPGGYVSHFDQKLQVFSDLFGFDASTSPSAGLQFALLALLATAGVIARVRLREGLSLAAVIAFVLATVSFAPTPTYTQYFSIVVPFVIVDAVRFIALVWREVVEAGASRARMILGSALAVGLVVYVFPVPFDVYRYTTDGKRVPGVYETANAVNWTIPTVRRVTRAIDDEMPVAGLPALTLWPGYLLESSKAVHLPKFEDPNTLFFTKGLTREQVQRYRLVSPADIEWHVRNHDARVVIVGNWMWGTEQSIRDLALQNGYVLARRESATELYVWRDAVPVARQ